MILRLTKIAGISISLIFISLASYAGDPAQGKEKSQTCVSCHGETGISVSPQYPHLAGQYEDYLVQALVDYRDGDRDNAVMKGFAAALSDDDIEDLAAYFASQEGLFTPSEDQW